MKKFCALFLVALCNTSASGQDVTLIDFSGLIYQQFYFEHFEDMITIADLTMYKQTQKRKLHKIKEISIDYGGYTLDLKDTLLSRNFLRYHYLNHVSHREVFSVDTNGFINKISRYPINVQYTKSDSLLFEPFQSKTFRHGDTTIVIDGSTTVAYTDHVVYVIDRLYNDFADYSDDFCTGNEDTAHSTIYLNPVEVPLTSMFYEYDDLKRIKRISYVSTHFPLKELCFEYPKINQKNILATVRFRNSKDSIRIFKNTVITNRKGKIISNCFQRIDKDIGYSLTYNFIYNSHGDIVEQRFTDKLRGEFDYTERLNIVTHTYRKGKLRTSSWDRAFNFNEQGLISEELSFYDNMPCKVYSYKFY